MYLGPCVYCSDTSRYRDLVLSRFQEAVIFMRVESVCSKPSIVVSVVRAKTLRQGHAILDSTMSAQGSDVAIETSLGSFTVELYWDQAPKVRKCACKCTTTETSADVQELCRAGQEGLL